jgi:hypothetical protein
MRSLSASGLIFIIYFFYGEVKFYTFCPMRYLTLLLLLSACSNELYVPNTRNVPLFREQGEAQISGYLCSSGIEGQGAYALTDNLAVIGSYSYLSSKETSPVAYDRKGTYGEIGFGYFNRTRAVRFELIGGYGMGEGTTADQYYFYGVNNTVVATGKMSRYFFQPSLGSNNRNFNVALTPRFSWVNYSEFSAAAGTQKPNESTQMFIEPAFTAKFRLAGNLHGIIQLGMTVPVPGEVFFNYSKMQTAIGIQIDTGGLRTKVY